MNVRDLNPTFPYQAAMTIAMPMRANSLGWIEMPDSRIHRRLPFTAGKRKTREQAATQTTMIENTQTGRCQTR